MDFPLYLAETSHLTNNYFLLIELLYERDDTIIVRSISVTVIMIIMIRIMS